MLKTASSARALEVPMSLVHLDLGGTTVELIAHEVDDMDRTLADLTTEGRRQWF